MTLCPRCGSMDTRPFTVPQINIRWRDDKPRLNRLLCDACGHIGKAYKFDYDPATGFVHPREERAQHG